MLYSIIHLERQFQLDSGSFEGNNSWDYDRANLLQSNLTLHAALTIGQGIDSISKVFFVNTDLSKKKKKRKIVIFRTYYSYNSCNFDNNNNNNDTKNSLRRCLIKTRYHIIGSRKSLEILNLHYYFQRKDNLELDFFFFFFKP